MIRPIFEPGGVTRSVTQLAQGLAQRGHTVTLAAHSHGWFNNGPASDLPIDVVPLHPSTPVKLLYAVPALRRVVRQRNIHLIHSHHRFTNVCAQIVSTLCNVPVICTVHEFKFDQPYLTRFGLRGPVVTFSQALRDHLVRHYHVPAHRVHVQPMGIDPMAYSSPTGPLPRPSCPVIGCVARLVEGKGVDVLIRALVEVRREWGAHFCCQIIGEGPLRPSLEQLVETLGLTKLIRFTGWRDDILDAVAGTDFLILPSLREGLGLVILEGWLMAKPTIGSNVGGIPELIRHQHNGLLVPPDDATALARAILYLLRQPKLVETFGQTGLETVLESHPFDGIVTQTERLYQEAVHFTPYLRG